MFKWLRRQTAADIISDKLFEATRLAAEHDLAAEHHGALASMYHARIKRLSKPASHRVEPELDSKTVAMKRRIPLSSIPAKVAAQA